MRGTEDFELVAEWMRRSHETLRRHRPHRVSDTIQMENNSPSRVWVCDGYVESGASRKWLITEFYNLCRMYGFDWVDDDSQPEPKKPEPNPIDKAIDDMMARRKAKREQPVHVGNDPWADDVKERQQGEALDRALSKAFAHHSSFAERLIPYRGPDLESLSR